jgi:spore photoproduct lyase
LQISTLYIDRDVTDFPETEAIRNRMNVPCRVVEGAGQVYDILSHSPDPVGMAKRILFITRNKGAFIRDCPGTSHYTCCNYRILHIGTFCTMDCAYCILQSYFHPPVLQFFINHGDLFAALDNLFSEKTITRIGTGEFTDSLIWDDLLPLSSRLIERFAGQSRAVLELKTKTVNIAHLLGCETEYLRVIDRVFQSVDPGNIVWISLGTMRFMPGLKTVIEQRFADSAIACGEFVKGMDGKFRYFKPLRIAMYRRMIDRIRFYAPDAMIYFCMEDDEVWRKSLGFIPSERGGLPAMLDGSAVQCCGLQVDDI